VETYIITFLSTP